MSLPSSQRIQLETCLQSIVQQIKLAKNLILTTHKQCDGDGLGAQLALYYALTKINKNVRVFCVDEVPRKYQFLEFNNFLEIYNKPHKHIESCDLTLIFDTNDSRLVEPFYTQLKAVSKKILFIDHHPVLKQGPEPTDGSYIDTSSASTGEIAYYIINELGISLDKKIARALYTSIAFDTQVFRFIKNSSRSHLIAAELLKHEKHPEDIHRSLFAGHTKGKIQLLAKAFSSTEFFGDYEEIAFLQITAKDLIDNGLQADDSRDILDMIMSVSSIEIGALLLQTQDNGYKLSLRSRGKVKIVEVAENFGGGGHDYAAGAYIEGDLNTIKNLSIKHLEVLLKK